MAEIRTDADKKANENLNEILRELPSYCKTFIDAKFRSKSIRTLLGYATDLRTFLYYVKRKNPEYRNKPISNIKFDDIKSFNVHDIEEFVKDISSYTAEIGSDENKKDIERHNGDDAIRRKVASLSAFYGYFYSLDGIPGNPVSKYELPKRKDKDIVVLESDEVDLLLSKLNDQSVWTDSERRIHQKTKCRDIALYTLLLSTGLRISEAIGLNMKDLDFNRREFRIWRKGGKTQIIGMNENVYESLKDYIENERPFLTDDENEPAVFMSLRKNRLSPRQVQTMTKAINERLFPLKHITPHKFRSTFGTNFQKQNKDIYLTASALGHADVSTTKKRYARQDQQDVTDAFKGFM